MRSCIAVFLLVALACATSPYASRDAEDRAKRFAPPDADHSRIYIYRTAIFAGDAILAYVWLDGQIAGSLGPREFLALDVEPGAHSVSHPAVVDAAAWSIEAPAGRVAFFSYDVVSGRIERVDDETGQKHVAAYRMAWSPVNGEDALER